MKKSWIQKLTETYRRIENRVKKIYENELFCAIASFICAAIIFVGIIFLNQPDDSTVITGINIIIEIMAEVVFLGMGFLLLFFYDKKKKVDDTGVVKERLQSYNRRRHFRQKILGYKRKYHSMEQELMFYNRGMEFLISVISYLIFALLVYIEMEDYFITDFNLTLIHYIVIMIFMLFFLIAYLLWEVFYLPRKNLKAALNYGKFKRDEVNRDYLKGKVFPMKRGLVNIGNIYFLCYCNKCCFILPMSSIRSIATYQKEIMLETSTKAKIIQYGIYLDHAYGRAQMLFASDNIRQLIIDELIKHGVRYTEGI